LQDFDPQDVPTEVGVGTNIVATPTHTNIITQTQHASHSYHYTPRVDVGTTPDPDEHMPECAQDDVDAEHGFAHFEACFPGSSHVTSTGTLKVTFLVNYELIPMKIENLPGI
jgi:hypothetical protein